MFHIKGNTLQTYDLNFNEMAVIDQSQQDMRFDKQTDDKRYILGELLNFASISCD